MPKRPAKKPDKQLDLPAAPHLHPSTRVLPMQLQVEDRMTDSSGEWEVVGRPHSTAGGNTEDSGDRDFRGTASCPAGDSAAVVLNRGVHAADRARGHSRSEHQAWAARD